MSSADKMTSMWGSAICCSVWMAAGDGVLGAIMSVFWAAATVCWAVAVMRSPA